MAISSTVLRALCHTGQAKFLMALLLDSAWIQLISIRQVQKLKAESRIGCICQKANQRLYMCWVVCLRNAAIATEANRDENLHAWFVSLHLGAPPVVFETVLGHPSVSAKLQFCAASFVIVSQLLGPKNYQYHVCAELSCLKRLT